MNKNLEAGWVLDELRLQKACVEGNLAHARKRLKDAEGQEDSISTFGRIYDKGLIQGYEYALEKLNKAEEKFLNFAQKLNIKLES